MHGGIERGYRRFVLAELAVNRLGWATRFNMPEITRLEKSKADWRKLLPPQVYSVLFDARTEAPFSSLLDREKRRGTFVCAVCREEAIRTRQPEGEP